MELGISGGIGLLFGVPACMAGAAFARGHAAGSFVIDRKGISERKGRSGAAFAGSEEARREAARD